MVSNSYGVLRLTISIDLVSDLDSTREPSTPKVFIWEFTPSIQLLIDGNPKALNYDKSLVQSKVIKKWINALYSATPLSQVAFHSIATQFFTLEFLFNLLSNADFITEINAKLDKKPLIVYVENKLFPPNSSLIEAFMEKDLIHKMSNYYTGLRNLQRKNWFLIGCYEEFVHENSLLKELDNNEKAIARRKSNFMSDFKTRPLSEIFQNDFLFLNNHEFSQQSYNTHGWDVSSIISPRIINANFTSIDERKLYKPSSTDEESKREIYLYIKTKPDSRFYRFDLIIPDVNLETDKLKELISIARWLKNE